MTRSIKTRRIGRRLGKELKAAIKLSPLALAALLLVVVSWRSDSIATSGLFQSSPVESPTVVPPATATPTTPPVQVTDTPVPPGGGTPTTEATLPVPTVTLTAVPTATVTAEPTLTPEPSLTVEPTLTQGTATPTPTGATATGEAEATPDDRARYPEGDSNLEFEWGMLFDSVSLFLSYAWLCCGVLVFLAVPVVFIVLWVASKRRQQQEGD